MNYVINLIKPTIISPLFYEMNSIQFSLFALYFLFSLQVMLFGYLLVATLLTQYWAKTIKRRLVLERKIDIINSILHWYFTFYPVFFIIMASVCLSAITCGDLGLFYQTDSNVDCSSLIVVIPSVFAITLAFTQGIVLIYLLRNHRYNENNCFKRRFAILQMINFSLQFLLIVFHYQNQVISYYLRLSKFEISLIFKYSLAIAYCFIQICDQFYSCPYRDPFRSPSLSFAIVIQWVTIISSIFKFSESYITEEQLFYWLFLPTILLCGFSDVMANLFHEYAMVNYNSKNSLYEKYIILGVDQLYQFYQIFQKSDDCKIKFYSQIINHNQNCSNMKCPSQKGRFQEINPNDKVQLHKATILLLQCIFRSALARTLSKNGKTFQPNFEQLQLQYVSFLSDIAMRPLIAYVDLRRYQTNITRNPSIYFKELVAKISTELESQILDLQQRMIKTTQVIFDQTSRISEFSLHQQQKTVTLYQYFLPKFAELIERKIKHWEGLIEGYPDLRPLQNKQQSLCLEIDQLRQQINEKVNIPEWFFDKSAEAAKATKLKTLTEDEQNINILNLRLYSILFCCIINDLDRALYAEKCILEMIKDDRQKQIDIIDDQSLLQDETVIVIISMVREKGKIVNSNLLTLANFFEYDGIQDIKNVKYIVKQLKKREISKYLPAELQLFHDQLMDNFLQRGYSQYFVKKIHSFYLQKEGFLRECYVKLGNLFQEANDYVITASLLKLTNQEDVILFDADGKILGVSKSFFIDNFQKCNQFLQIDKFTKEGYLFLFFPQIFSVLRLYSLQINLNDEIVSDFIDYIYVSDELHDLCTEFQYINQVHNQEQKVLSSYNFLNSFRTKNSNQNRQTNDLEFSNRLNKLDLDKDGKIQDISIPIMNKEKINIYLDFLQAHCDQHPNSNYYLTKFKYTIQFRVIKTSKFTYPFFEMRIENLSTYDQQLSISNKLLPFSTIIKKVRNLVNVGRSMAFTTQSDILQAKSKTTNLMQNEEVNLSMRSMELQPQEGTPRQRAPTEDDKQPLKTEEVNPQNQTQDLIQAPSNDAAISRSSNLFYHLMQDEKAIFSNPIVPFDTVRIDEGDLQLLNEDVHVTMICFYFQAMESKPLNAATMPLKEVIQEEEEQEVAGEIEFEEVNDKNSSIKFNTSKKGKDLLDVLKSNKLNANLNNHDDDLQIGQQSSKASSSKTESSKSPFLLIRSMYQINMFQGNLLWITLLDGVIILTVFMILFFEINIVQDKYTTLKTNLNYVQYPETVNFYFMKMAMIGWVVLQQDVDIILYSEFINKQIGVEMTEVRQTVDKKLMQIYQDIITFESQVITTKIPFQIINNLETFPTNLDLTLLIEQFTSNTLGFVEQYELIQNTTGTSKKFNSKMLSNLLFFRLNLPGVNEFAKSYINFLNFNLIYYEDQIIYSLTFLIIGEIGFLTILILVQTRLWMQIHDYFEKTLVLTTRLSQEDAFDIIQQYQLITLLFKVAFLQKFT